MAYKYKEYNFNDCTITRVGDSIYIDIGRNKEIIPYIVEFISDKIKDVTEIVIVSDGVTDVVSDDVIAQTVIKCSNVDSAANELRDLAVKNNSRDNITAVVARIVHD